MIRQKMIGQETTSENAGRGIQRRDFLKVTVAASGGLLIGFHFFGVTQLASAQPPLGSSFMPNAFVRIGTDENITVIVNHSEMGQGVYTSLPMLLADELDADWSKIGYEPAPVDPKYNHPVFGVQMTGGSSPGWSCRARFADRCGGAAVECRCSHVPNGIGSGVQRHSQVDLWPARRRCGEVSSARERSTKRSKGLQVDRQAAQTPRHFRKDKRHG